MDTDRGADRALHAGPLREERRPRRARLRRAVAVVGRRPRGLLALDLRLLRGPLRHRAGEGARLARDAGHRVVPRRAPVLRRARVPRQGPGRGGDPPRLRAARPRRVDLGRPARGDRPHGHDPQGARRGGGRPRRRLHAEHPGDRGRLPGHRVAGRDLVERRARVRRAQRGRPLLADRAQGAARRRRLPLRRQGLRPQRRGRRTSPRRSATCRWSSSAT